jgi:hypothetical protein
MNKTLLPRSDHENDAEGLTLDVPSESRQIGVFESDIREAGLCDGEHVFRARQEPSDLPRNLTHRSLADPNELYPVDLDPRNERTDPSAG